MKVQISRQTSADIASQFAANNLLETVEVEAQIVEEVIGEVSTPDVPETPVDTAPETPVEITETPAPIEAPTETLAEDTTDTTATV